MSDESKAKSVNKVKVYVVAILLYLVLNGLVFETLLTVVENQQQTTLQPILPFTRTFLLIITILLANDYIRGKQGNSKQKLWWRISKGIILFVIAWLFFFGAWFSLSDAELERSRTERQNNPVVIPDLRQVQQSELIKPDFSNE